MSTRPQHSSGFAKRGCRGLFVVSSVSGLSGRPAFQGVSMEVWSQWKPGLLSVFLLQGLDSSMYGTCTRTSAESGTLVSTHALEQ
jgi:hypothetical protein